MNELLMRLQREAERIASKHPPPEFYIRFKAPQALARKLFFTSPVLVRLRRMVEPCLQEDLGHGLYHSTRVSLDTATLIAVELEADQIQPIKRERLMQLGLIGGLLHDICRNEEQHAAAGALKAARILRRFPWGREKCRASAAPSATMKRSPRPSPAILPGGSLSAIASTTPTSFAGARTPSLIPSGTWLITRGSPRRNSSRDSPGE